MSDIQFELDLATLDLKGKRFKEAEERYINLARKENSSVAWCGLAVAKFGQILDKQATVDEVFFCFEKAKNADLQEVTTIEKLTLQTSHNVIANLYSLCISIYNVGYSANKQKGRAIINGIAGGLLGGFSSKNLYGTVLSAGITATSYNSYLNSNATVEECKVQIKTVESIIREIIEKTKSFVQIDNEDLRKFIDSINALEKEVHDEIKPEAQKKLEAEQQQRQRSLEAEKDREIKIREDIANPNHPFNSIKTSAISYFDYGDFIEAHSIAIQGLAIYSKDEQLIKIKNEAEAKLKSKFKSGCLIDFIIGTVAIIVITIIANMNRDPTLPSGEQSPIPGLVMIGIIIFGVVRHFTRRKKLKTK